MPLTSEQKKARDKKIRERAKELGFNVKRMPGVGKENRYRGTIPGKYKGKLLFDSDEALYNTDFSDGDASIGTYRSEPNNLLPSGEIIKYEFYSDEEIAKAREKDMKEVIKEQEIPDENGRRGDPTKYLMRMPGEGLEKLYDGEIPSEFKGKLMYVSGHPSHDGVTIYSDKLEKEEFPRRHADEEIGAIEKDMDGKDQYFFLENLEIIEPPVKEKTRYEHIKDAREQRKEIKRQKKREEREEKSKAQDKEFQELRKQLQDTLKNDPNLPILRRPVGGWWGEFVDDPPLSYGYPEVGYSSPNPEQAEAIKNLRDINDIAVKDTSSNLKGDVNELMSLYGIR